MYGYSKDNVLKEVQETVADIVDDIDVMNRQNLLFGVSDTTLVETSLEVQDSFHLERPNKAFSFKCTWKKILLMDQVDIVGF